MARLTKRELQDKRKEDLLKIANGSLGLGLKQTMKKHDIINYILHNINRGGNSDVLEVMEEDEVKRTQNNDLPEGYAIVRLDKGKYNPRGRPVYVGASNPKRQRNALIPVGRPVKVPEVFIEPLMTSIRIEVHQDPVTLEEEEVEVPNYPFTILRHNPTDRWMRAHGDDYNLGAL